MHDHVTTEAIRDALLEHPDCVSDWVQYSEDKHCGAGWFLASNGADYEVGFFSSKAGRTPPTRFSNPLDGCAEFIKREIEEVRSSN